MSRRHPSSLRPKADMNLTAMSDLTFLLLIAFIIAFPMIEQGISIKLPTGKSQEIDPQKRTSTITVDEQGRVFLGMDLIEIDDLKTELANRLKDDPELRLIIRGDRDVNYGKVVEVARIATNLGITRMALATKDE